jgi:hypothetical protein
MLAVVNTKASIVSNKTRPSHHRHGLALSLSALRPISNQQISKSSKSTNGQISESPVTHHGSRVTVTKYQV